MTIAITFEKVAGLVNAWTAVEPLREDGGYRVLGRVFLDTATGEPLFWPAPGQMSIRPAMLEALAGAMRELAARERS